MLAYQLDHLQRFRNSKPIKPEEYEELCVKGDTDDLTVKAPHNVLEDIAEQIREIVLADEERGA